jgi:hypothetical protein
MAGAEVEENLSGKSRRKFQIKYAIESNDDG